MTTIDQLSGEILDTKPHALTTSQLTAMEAEEARAVAQVQAGMAIAQKFPRDEQAQLSKILVRCRSIDFALQSRYSFKRGNTQVTGASIRLLEGVAQLWKHIDFSVEELVRDEERKQSVALTYAVDLENNVWSRRKFIVPHRRDKTDGPAELKSDRDIYEMVANMGARRVRACLEAVIPGHIVEAALEECDKTRAEHDKKEPLEMRAKKLVHAFVTNLKISEVQIAKWLKRPIAEMLENDFQNLRSIYFGIRDGASRVEDHFEAPTVADKMAAGRNHGGAGSQGGGGSPSTEGTRPTTGEQGTASGRPSAQKPPAATDQGGRSGGNSASEHGGDREPSTGRDTPAGPVQDDHGGDRGGSQGKSADDEWPDFSKETAADQGKPTKASVLAKVRAARSIGDLNALGNEVKQLPKDEQKDCRLASAARVKELQAAGVERQQSME